MSSGCGGRSARVVVQDCVGFWAAREMVRKSLQVKIDKIEIPLPVLWYHYD